MDSYAYNLDPYRQTSASYYPPRYASSYGLDRRSSYVLPPADPLSSYARVPLDPYTVYGAAPATFQPDVVLQPRYVRAPTSVVYRSPRPRSRPAPRKRGSPPPKLGPKKKPFKQVQQVKFTEGKQRPSKQDVQKKPSQAVQNSEPRPSSQAASLAKETEELHKLFRTGNTGKQGEGKKANEAGNTGKQGSGNKANESGNMGKKGEGNKASENRPAKKRKAETQMQKPTTTKGPDSAKQQKGKKKRSPSRDLKVADDLMPLEGIRKGVRQFLGMPEMDEVPDAIVTKDAADVSESDAKEEASKKTEEPIKPEEPQRTPEQEKEIEANSLKYFSSLFEEHKELRDHYIENCNSGSFRCLLCYSSNSINSTKGKVFWNLVSLVMHTKQCSRKRPEHTGYGRAVSAVLGWDHEKTPKVPHGSKPVIRTEQVNEETKQEIDDKHLEIDKTEAELNATVDRQEEEVSENPPSEDIKED